MWGVSASTNQVAKRGWGGPRLLLRGRCGVGLASGMAGAGREDAGAAATFRRC